MHKKLLKICSLICLCNMNVYATNLEISPLRLEISNTSPLSSLTVYNKEKNISLIETEIYKWTQKDGSFKDGIVIFPIDDLEKITSEISVFPKNIVIKNHSEQTIRIKLNNQKNNTHKEYRILLNEQKNPTVEERDISFLTTFSLPIFTYEEKKKNEEFKNGLLIKKFEDKQHHYLEVKNNNHQTIKLIEVFKKNNDELEQKELLGYYLLPKIKGYIKIDKSITSIQLKTDKGIFNFNLK